MREIVLDTETTGINPSDGHRIIEIGALEMFNQTPTGEQFHIYINPEREIDAGAVNIHGLTQEFLSDKPVFADVVAGFLEFIGGSQLVIHNAPFDMGFINAELTRLGMAALPVDRAVDTLTMARRKFPGAQASLDALCRRFEIDNSHRDLHGALVDADLLATVYIELLGGRQRHLSLEPDGGKPAAGAPEADNAASAFTLNGDPSKFDRPHGPSDEELAAHRALLARLEDPVWNR
ncbi:MAG: DNA polymerase III subunit epsilon [SAR116 cluster bacterium]|jgi:DNA polymerase-3 subunit epsilon|nr:DNA polymerase III subunit epsilon [SAR116 cluster bacterium]RPG98810.1 MAG: DNA polymerase III subunit epsilon [Candidatus Puniceispirillum sp. TMED176]RZO31232.1 MAG: DNA polymerase III subunit epsilon [SAR116 cluster bacterium]|tara:strand:- start:7729 stop:8433 length:705 start_codon:yes stop_codon:yes gene_type:complete